MSSTETFSLESLALSLFDEIVTPLAESRRSAGKPAYFASKGDAGLHTYFVPPTAAVMPPAEFEFPGGGTADGLIDALATYWKSRGEESLSAMAPRLKEIAAALKNELDEGDGSVDIMCYTMF